MSGARPEIRQKNLPTGKEIRINYGDEFCTAFQKLSASR